MLKQGETGVIRQFLDEQLSAKLLQMGLLPGNEIQLVRAAPLGCPLYLKSGGNYLALRKTEAVNVIVE